MIYDVIANVTAHVLMASAVINDPAVILLANTNGDASP